VRASWRVRDTGAFGHGMPCPYCGNVKVKINGNCAGETSAVRTATAAARELRCYVGTGRIACATERHLRGRTR
jgi:hypothetical protein